MSTNTHTTDTPSTKAATIPPSTKATNIGAFLLRIFKAIFIRKKDCCK